MWDLLGQLMALYVVGAVITFMVTKTSEERFVNAFRTLHRVDEQSSMILFRIGTAAIWPLFWIAGALAAGERRRS